MIQSNEASSKMHLVVWFFALSLLWPIPVLSNESKRLLTLDDFSAIKNVSAPQISPDGLWVAYTVTEVDTKADVTRSDIWLTHWDSSATKQLTATAASEHSPRWSPDGRRLAYLSTGRDTQMAEQLWLIDPSTKISSRVTSLVNGVSDFDWGPNSRHIAIISDLDPPGSSEGSDESPIVIDKLVFKVDGVGYLGSARARLLLLDLKDRSVVQLSNGASDEILPSFSPDGTRIAYVTKLGENSDRHDNWDILSVETKAGAKPSRVSDSNFMECDPIGGWNYGAAPTWSPDGSSLSCIQGGAAALSWFSLQQVVVFAASGDHGSQPTASLDRNTLLPRFSADGQHLFFILEDDQSTLLASIGVDGKGFKKITQAGKTVSEYSLGPQGKLAVLSSSPDAPAEIFVVEENGLRQLTHANDEFLASVELASTEVIHFPSSGGVEIHGLMIKPPGFRADVRYPTLLRLHGGPVSQWQQEYNQDWQIMAAQGYVIIAPNPRGSSGRGFDFQKTIFGDWGNVDTQDVLAAADYAVKIGIADEDRLGVGGWSAGAMLTNYTIASDTRFKAATSGAGISNMLAGLGTDQWWQIWESELGLPWEKPENWERVSYPYLHADRIKTPTLFLCGSEDYNVPLIHSEQMYTALKRLDVPTRLIVYPGQSHDIGKPSFQRDILERYLNWYGKWLL